MKINDQDAVRNPVKVGPGRSVPKLEEAAAPRAVPAHPNTPGEGRRAAYVPRHGTAPRGVRDVAELHGIDLAGLDPATARALGELEAEAGSWHEALATAEGRIALLEEEADRDWLTGLMNRPAALREIGRLQTLDRQNATRSSLIGLSLDDQPDLLRRFGRPGLEAIVAEAAQALARAAHPRPLGRLGMGDFLVFAIGREAAEAEARARQLAEAAGGQASWRGEGYARRFIAAIHPLGVEEDPAEALAHLDAGLADAAHGPAARR